MEKENMGAAVMTADEDIREKIKVVLHKLDKMESRVKNVEAVAAVLPRIEKKLATVVSRVESVANINRPSGPPLVTPPPVKAFISGASIGVLVVGAIVAAWILEFF
jgi:hypothetical protein